MASALRNRPELFTDHHVENLCIGLDYLITETSLVSPPPTEEVFSPAVPFTLRPEYRSSSAKLARAVAEVLKMRNKPSGIAIAKWQEICQTDSLPEVRLAWIGDS